MRKKKQERQLAAEYRQQGMSYEEIRKLLEGAGFKVAMGSIHNWLKDVPLSAHQMARLKEIENNGRIAGRCKIAVNRQNRRVSEVRPPAPGFSQ